MDVGAVDLIERRVARRTGVAAVVEPLVPCPWERPPRGFALGARGNERSGTSSEEMPSVQEIGQRKLLLGEAVG